MILLWVRERSQLHKTYRGIIQQCHAAVLCEVDNVVAHSLQAPPEPSAIELQLGRAGAVD